MEKIELAKMALENVHGETFNFMIGCTDGSKFGDGFTDYMDIELSRGEVLYLIINPEFEGVFGDFDLIPLDLDSMLKKISFESSWPDGGPTARVNNIIPYEVIELSERLSELDVDDTAAIQVARQQLINIQDGEYTFNFDVYDGSNSYCFVENAKESIKLSSDEVRALLKHEHDIPEVFDGICGNKLDDHSINEKAKEAGIAEVYDCFSYVYYCEEMDNFIESWKILITKIMSGEIGEEDLVGWLEYFKDSNNFEYSLEDWKEIDEDE